MLNTNSSFLDQIHGERRTGDGIHNGARGTLKAWQLSERDQETLKQQPCTEMILKDLPKYLFLEMKTPMKAEQWFPMAHVTKYWCLDSDESIDICRRGFPLVPDFSTTIDAATGENIWSFTPPCLTIFL